jgi:hypothetical protein
VEQRQRILQREKSITGKRSNIRKQQVKKNVERMEQRYFIESWLLRCLLQTHRTANPALENGLRHFSALPFLYPIISERVEKKMK